MPVLSLFEVITRFHPVVPSLNACSVTFWGYHHISISHSLSQCLFYRFLRISPDFILSFSLSMPVLSLFEVITRFHPVILAFNASSSIFCGFHHISISHPLSQCQFYHYLRISPDFNQPFSLSMPVLSLF